MIFKLFFPRVFFLFEHRQQILLFIAETCGQFKILAFYSQYFLIACLFDPFLKFDDPFGNCNIRNVDPRTGLVQCINGFIGQVAVRYVPCCKPYTGFNGFGGISYIVMVFVPLLNIMEYFNRLFHSCGFNHYLLKSTFKGSVLFDVLTVFVQCCCPNTLNITTCKGRFKHIGSIQRTCGATGTYNGMDFVYK